MAYHFAHTDASVEAALQRIGTEQLAGAARSLREAPMEPAVHSARKAIKRSRALLRLLRSGLREFSEENRRLRDIGRGLSALRESHVAARLLDSLCEEAGLSAEERAGLALARGEQVTADPGDLVAEAADALERMARGARAWRLRGDPRKVLVRGLGRTAADGRGAMAMALEAGSVEALHEFRKRVKDRWYQARLMRAVWPEAMAVEIAAADSLAERLGDDHDLALLAGRLTGTGEARDRIVALIARKRARGLSEAEVLGRRLYSEAPEALSARWLGWWACAEPSLPPF